jgi:uncharacterized membrane protein
MLSPVVDFINLFLAALLMGTMFCTWLVFNPAHLDASHYIILQQQGIRALNRVMPLLGALTILVTIGSAVLGRENRTRVFLLAGTALLFIVSGLITRFANQPINAIVLGWNDAATPAQWTVLRDTWWRWHCLRLCTASAGAALLMIASLLRKPYSFQGAGIAIARPLTDGIMRTLSLLL